MPVRSCINNTMLRYRSIDYVVREVFRKWCQSRLRHLWRTWCSQTTQFQRFCLVAYMMCNQRFLRVLQAVRTATSVDNILRSSISWTRLCEVGSAFEGMAKVDSILCTKQSGGTTQAVCSTVVAVVGSPEFIPTGLGAVGSMRGKP